MLLRPQIHDSKDLFNTEVIDWVFPSELEDLGQNKSTERVKLASMILPSFILMEIIWGHILENVRP